MELVVVHQHAGEQEHVENEQVLVALVLVAEVVVVGVVEVAVENDVAAETQVRCTALSVALVKATSLVSSIGIASRVLEYPAPYIHVH